MRLPDFSKTRLSRQRSFFDYGKVQEVCSGVIRNSKYQLRKLNISERPYLNLGCGPFPHSDFINADYKWRPGVQLCWDFRKEMPLPAAMLEGIFSEHCLEHMTKEDAGSLLKRLRPSLKKDGRIRLVVPDAELYLDLYTRRRSGESVLFPYEEDQNALGKTTPMDHVNRIFRGYGHQYAYDYETLAALLSDAGYQNIERCRFRQGKKPELLIDQAERQVESLYVEASP